MDCGDVKAGDLFEKHIRIKNTGDENLYVLNVYKSCTCTQVTLSDSVLRPGEEKVIRIRIETEGKRGLQTIIVKLTLNTKRKYEVIRLNVNYI